jgi:hypothetical protein
LRNGSCTKQEASVYDSEREREETTYSSLKVL